MEAPSAQNGSLDAVNRIMRVLVVVLIGALAVGVAGDLVRDLGHPGPPRGSADATELPGAIALLVLMFGSVAFFGAAFVGVAIVPATTRFAPLICALAVAFVGVRYFAWDSYFDNTRRFSDNGSIAVWVVAATGLLGLVAALADRRARDLRFTACLLGWCVLLAMFVQGGD